MEVCWWRMFGCRRLKRIPRMSFWIWVSCGCQNDVQTAEELSMWNQGVVELQFQCKYTIVDRM